tara:strand:+ start:1409 stop:1639 length:231 start_codon:yes stop_codon:yes gene_type:complete
LPLPHAPKFFNTPLEAQTTKRETPICQLNLSRQESGLMDAFLLYSIPSKSLRKPIATLRHFRDEIIAAVDFAINGI